MSGSSVPMPYSITVIATELVHDVEDVHYTVCVLRPDQIDLIAERVIAKLKESA